MSMSVSIPLDAGEEEQQTEIEMMLQRGAQVREGSVHFCQGPLLRKRHRAQAKKKKWKPRWFKLQPAYNRNGIYQLTESNEDEQSTMDKLIFSLPVDKPNISVAPASTDPTSPDFGAFNVFQSQTDGELLNTFRATDIVQQRAFMAALGGKGPGLFTQPQNSDTVSDIDSYRSDSPKSPLQQLVTRQRIYNSMSQNSQLPEICKQVPKTFQEALQKFPGEFYFPNFELPTPCLPGVKLPQYNPLEQIQTRTVPLHPRKIQFRPPHGTPINYPTMIGCGTAAGLQPSQIAVWDQENEFYYFLDCARKTVSANDPRQKPSFKPTIRKSQISVQKRQSEDSTIPPCDPAIVRATADRASRKPHGCVLRAFGKSGKSGMSGANGKKGVSGAAGLNSHSADSRDGEQGMAGDDGRHGEWGEDGEMGKNVIVELYGDANELGISGTCLSFARLGGEDSEAILLVDCSGGDGGDGGNGGDGGRGGAGGDGARGENGDDGGHGGNGGTGGRGGSGGNGGNGGRGGNCIVRAADPRLLMLVEINCDSGRPGKPGQRGRGGKGGEKGFGGAGSSSSPNEACTFAGLQGKPGMSGTDAEDGVDGIPGFSNKAGSLEWVITSPDGNVEHSAATRYEAEVISMKVSSSFEGDVFEPHQQIQVTGLVVVNSGGLPLPAGAKVSIPSTDTVRFEPTTYTLPKLEPAEHFVVPAVFSGRIIDEPSPNTPGPFTHTCQFSTRVEMLGRPFEKSCLEKRFTVQYPVKLAYALAKKDIGQGEVATLEIGIENVSTIPYGAGNKSGGSVLVRILLESSLHPLSLAESPSSDSFTANYDPDHTNSVFILIKDLQPGTILTVPIVVQMQKEAELSNTCKWQAEVYLRGKLIEYSSAEIRVAPEYSSEDMSVHLADALLIKTDNLYEEEMLFWQRIFELLGVTYDYWDANYSDGEDSISSQQFSLFQNGENEGKLIVFPHCDLRKLRTEEIVSHFKRDDSSMVLFLDDSIPDSLEQYIHQSEGNKKILRHLCCNEKRVDIAPELYSGLHLFSPGTVLPSDWTLRKAQKDVLRKLEQDVPSQAPVMVAHSDIIRRQGMKYSYGRLNIKRCPLSRTSNFQCIDGAACRMAEMGADDPYLTLESRKVPLASHFGQVFLATLAGLPLHLKLPLLGQTLNRSSRLFIQFHLPNGLTLTKKELAAVCLAHDIADEVLAGTSDLQRMHTLIKHIKDASSSTTPDVSLLTQLLDLIKRETSQRQAAVGKTQAQVSQAVKKLLALCGSAAQHLPSSPTGQLAPLPQLHQLQNRLAVLRPHQLIIDELFDLDLSLKTQFTSSSYF